MFYLHNLPLQYTEVKYCVKHLNTAPAKTLFTFYTFLRINCFPSLSTQLHKEVVQHDLRNVETAVKKMTRI